MRASSLFYKLLLSNHLTKNPTTIGTTTTTARLLATTTPTTMAAKKSITLDIVSDTI